MGRCAGRRLLAAVACCLALSAVVAQDTKATIEGRRQAGLPREARQAATTESSLVGDRAVAIKDGVRTRTLRARKFYGYFLMERYYSERFRKLAGPATTNHLLHLFYWTNEHGWREDGVRWDPDGGPRDRTSHAFDGRCYRLYESLVGERVNIVKRSVPLVPGYLDYARWPGAATPSEGLLKAPIDTVARERVGDWDCWRLEAPRADGGRDSWWVCSDLDHAIVKSWHRWPAPADVGREGTGLRVVDRFERFGSTWVPMVERTVNSIVGPDGKAEYDHATRLTTVELHDGEVDGALPFAFLGWPVSVEYDDGSHERRWLGGDVMTYLVRIRNGPEATVLSPMPVAAVVVR